MFAQDRCSVQQSSHQPAGLLHTGRTGQPDRHHHHHHDHEDVDDNEDDPNEGDKFDDNQN